MSKNHRQHWDSMLKKGYFFQEPSTDNMDLSQMIIAFHIFRLREPPNYPSQHSTHQTGRATTFITPRRTMIFAILHSFVGTPSFATVMQDCLATMKRKVWKGLCKWWSSILLIFYMSWRPKIVQKIGFQIPKYPFCCCWYLFQISRVQKWCSRNHENVHQGLDLMGRQLTESDH